MFCHSERSEDSAFILNNQAKLWSKNMLKRISLVGVMIIFAVSMWCNSSLAAVWLSDNFDSYNIGDLAAQGNWLGAANSAKVEATYVQSGKSVEANYLEWASGDVNRSVSSGGGYQYIEFDAAMDTAAESVSQNLGYLMILNSSGAEITRVYFAHQEFKVLLSGGERPAIQGNVSPKTWYHIKLGINLNVASIDVWVDGVQKVASGWTYGFGSSIGRITFGQWANLGSNFTKSEMYLDNLVCYSMPAPEPATLLKAGDGWSGWERKNLFHPYVVYDSAAGNYKMLFSSMGQAQDNESAWDQWAISLATSTDTKNWTRKTDDYEPVLYPRKFYQGEVVDPDETKAVFDSMGVFDQCIIRDGSIYKMWYTGWGGELEHIGGGIENRINTRIGYATSPDLINWTKQTGSSGCGSVFGVGPAGSQDAKGVGNPSVIKEGSVYRMWYEGFDGSTWRIFYATSADGINWTRQGIALTPGNSGALDELGARYPVVITRNGQYELWYQGKSVSSPNYRVMRATSQNGLTWSKVASEVTLHPNDILDGTEDIHVDSILVQPDNSCKVFFSKQNTSNIATTFGTVADTSYCIYMEVVVP